MAGDPAYSADPIDYDAGGHPAIFSSVHAWLVTNYRVGRTEGQLAEKWSRSDDFKEWTFDFRPGLTFENGDPITPKDLADSWLRLIRLEKAKGSRPGFLAQLEGYDAFPQRAESITGMTYDDHRLILKFRKPMPKLLDQVAFGTYALVHRSCYDAKTGRWLDPKKTIASGPYRIAEWDGSHMLLVLRPDFPAALRHPRPLQSVRVHWEDGAVENGAKKDAGLILTSSHAQLAPFKYEYHGGADSGIYFMRCQSWRSPRSPLSNRSLRRRLRLVFYEELKKQNIRPEASFFPLQFKGVHELSPELDAKDAAVPVPSGAVLRYTVGDSTETLVDKDAAMQAAIERLGFRFEQVGVPFKVQVAEHQYGPNADYKDDLAAFGTGIDFDDPDNDIRFMIRSKEGINLPDPTGRLAEAIRKSPIDMQRVNEILWDDAIVWPFMHVSSGVWAKPEFDLSQVNVLLPPTPLYLIGWKG